MTTKPKWLTNATQRLRTIAVSRALKAQDGSFISEGYPYPVEIEQELRRAYRSGKKARTA